MVKGECVKSKKMYPQCMDLVWILSQTVLKSQDIYQTIENLSTDGISYNIEKLY